MPFDPIVTAAVESTLNLLIKDDPELARRLGRLKGKVIQVELQEFSKKLTFVFSHQVDVLAKYEGEPDCFLSLKLQTLPELREQANITRLIKQDKLVLEGDIQLAQSFARLLTDARPDIEEWLSRLTGDVVAHTLVSGVKGGLSFLKQEAGRKHRHLGEAITEEWRLAPPPLELAYFCDQVDDLARDVARLEARLNALGEKL